MAILQEQRNERGGRLEYTPPKTNTSPKKRDDFTREYIFQPLTFGGQSFVFRGVVLSHWFGNISKEHHMAMMANYHADGDGDDNNDNNGDSYESTTPPQKGRN